MKNIKTIVLLIFISIIFIPACTDSYMGIEQVKTNNTIPDKVTVNRIIPKSGALEIHFSLPKGNPDIAQIVASYINRQGRKMEFKVSRYSSSIMVEGFVGTDEVTVELICIDNSGNESEIVYAKAAPLKSPVDIALENMNVEPVFGGVKIDWINPEGNSLAIHVLSEDNLDVYETTLEENPNNVVYTSDSINTYAYIRPFSSRKQQFGFVVSDKWGNRSDTLIVFLTPLKEDKINLPNATVISAFNWSPYSGNRDYNIYGVDPITGIQNDGNNHNSATFHPNTIFDGKRKAQAFYVYKFIKNFSNTDASTHEIVHDVFITYDLNRQVRLSRFFMLPRPHISYTYDRSSIKRFRIYGTDDSNDQKFSKFPETWTLIGEYVGRDANDLNNLTPEEIEYFNEEQEFMAAEDNVNPDANPLKTFRYLRLHFMESYDRNIPYYTLNNLEMYGEYIQ